MTDIPEDAKPVGWFSPWNDYHGYQQVAKDYEGKEHVLPLYSREEVARLLLSERRKQIERDAKIAERIANEWGAEVSGTVAAYAAAVEIRAQQEPQ